MIYNHFRWAERTLSFSFSALADFATTKLHTSLQLCKKNDYLITSIVLLQKAACYEIPIFFH